MNLLNKDELYDVLKEPTRENFRYLLQNHLGEEDYLDFKQEWPSKEKNAKHILAMANSGGGCIIYGVVQKDDGSFSTDGLEKFKDKADLNNELKKFIPEKLKYYVKDFYYETSEYEAVIGKRFQILVVEDIPLEIPFVCQGNGKNINNGEIYVRRGTESEKATSIEIDNMLKRKINAYSLPRKNNMNLEKHLNQLKLLYSELTYTTTEGGLLNGISDLISKSIRGESINHKKDCYPKEDYDEFIVRMLDKKKKRIEEELDV